MNQRSLSEVMLGNRIFICVHIGTLCGWYVQVFCGYPGHTCTPIIGLIIHFIQNKMPMSKDLRCITCTVKSYFTYSYTQEMVT